MYGKTDSFMHLKIIAAFLVAVVIAFGMSVSAVSSDNKSDYETATISAPSEYQLVAESEDLSLFANMTTGDFMLANTKGNSWYSTPVDISDDPYSKAATVAQLKSLISLTYINTEEVVSTSKKYSLNGYNAVSAGGASVSKIENGIRIEFTFEDFGFFVPIEYSLESGYLNASIDVESIREGEDYKILQIELLPGLCTGNWKENGYIFVPDGCGALINYNNGSESKYSEMVYGEELAIEKELNSVTKETIRLPVFGTTSSEKAMFGIITDGDGSAIINAASSNGTSGYNTVSTGFVMRSITPKAMLTKSYAKQYAYRISNIDKNLKKFTVRYYPLCGESANYSGFAKIYRDYLVNEKGLNKGTQKPSFNISLIGAVDFKANFLGFTYYKPTALTTFDEAKIILEELTAAGVNNVSMRYEGWQNDGLVNRKISTSAKPMRILGGKTGYENLLTYCNGAEISLFTDADFIRYNGGNNRNASKTVFNEVAKQYNYMYSVYAPRLDTKPIKLLSALKLQTTTEKYLKSYLKLENKAISLSSLTNTLYSNLGKKNFSSRTDMTNIVENILKSYTDSEIAVSGDAANAYAAPYLSKIFNAPANCSGFLMENEEIPFYQMVFHGYIPLTMPSQERATNPVDNYLTAVETGSELLWTGIFKDASILSDTTSDKYYSTTYTLWLSDALKKYEEYMPLLNKIAGAEIVSHKSISTDVTETVFGGNIMVIVNHSDKPFTMDDGTEIPAKSFLEIKKGE